MFPAGYGGDKEGKGEEREPASNHGGKTWGICERRGDRARGKAEGGLVPTGKCAFLVPCQCWSVGREGEVGVTTAGSRGLQAGSRRFKGLFICVNGVRLAA